MNSLEPLALLKACQAFQRTLHISPRALTGSDSRVECEFFSVLPPPPSSIMQMATPISPLWGVGEAHLAVQEVSRNTRPTSFHCCIAPKTLLGHRYVRSNSFTFRGANPKLMFYLMPPSKGEQKHHTSTCHRSVWALNPDPTPCRPFLSRDCRCKFMLSFMIFFFFVFFLSFSFYSQT